MKKAESTGYLERLIGKKQKNGRNFDFIKASMVNLFYQLFFVRLFSEISPSSIMTIVRLISFIKNFVCFKPNKVLKTGVT